LDPVLLHPHQLWLSSGSVIPPNRVEKLCGWDSDQLINYRLLSPLHDTRITNINPILPPSSPLSGGRFSFSLPPRVLLGDTPQRIYLSRPTSDKCYRWSQLITQPSTYSFSTSIPTFLDTWFSVSLFDALSILGEFDLFTDGAWNRTGSYWDHVTNNAPSFIGDAGLVTISKSAEWRSRPIISLSKDPQGSWQSVRYFLSPN
jgi:hypothetical protein